MNFCLHLTHLHRHLGQEIVPKLHERLFRIFLLAAISYAPGTLHLDAPHYSSDFRFPFHGDYPYAARPCNHLSATFQLFLLIDFAMIPDDDVWTVILKATSRNLMSDDDGGVFVFFRFRRLCHCRLNMILA